jgi:hypothetical protein
VAVLACLVGREHHVFLDEAATELDVLGIGEVEGADVQRHGLAGVLAHAS